MVKISCPPLQTVAARPFSPHKNAACLFFLVFFLLFNIFPARAGMKEDVEYLASPLLGGRVTGSVGAVETSWYVMRRFRAAGLEVSLDKFQTPSGVGRSVLGVHRGNPKSASYVLVTAYYDGPGSTGGEILPGADANASGVAMLLSLADSLACSGGNYIFAALDGHNSGRAGAESLALRGWKLGMVANIDIIGSTLAPPNKYRTDFLIVLGGERFEKQHSKEMDRLNVGPRLRIYYDYYRSKGFTDYFYNTASDQAPFLRRGVPAVMFTSGITMNTNKPGDIPQTLDYDVMERRRAFILSWLKTI